MSLTADIQSFILASARADAEGSGDDHETFDRLALRVFAHQSAHLPLVARYAAARGQSAPTTWQGIAPLPIAAFKAARLHDGVRPVVRTFESSGTSGARSVSAFSAEGLALMDCAIDVGARRSLFDRGEPGQLLVLAPPPSQAPTMIMAYGMERLIARFGAPGSAFFVGPSGLDTAGLLGALTAAVASQQPVTLIGASFGFVHLLDGLAARGLRFELPAGSRVMDAGGFKGRSRSVSRHELDRAIRQRFGLPAEQTINLLGMTELASQLYDAPWDGGERVKRGPRWTRTRVLDSVTLEEVADGGVGLLAHVDLANVERPMAILTDDLGRRVGDGFHVLGRATESDAKGCSLTLDDLLTGRS